MPGRETAPGFVVSDVPQQDQDLHAARKQAASALIPAIILRVDIRCYLRRIAAHVLVFAREIPRTCKSRCYLQRAPLILRANLGAFGSSNEPGRRFRSYPKTHADPGFSRRLGRRTALTFPLLAPPQKT